MIITKTPRGSWELPAGFHFISSRKMIVSHIRRNPEHHAMCGAAPNYSLAKPSKHSMSRLCPKCRKEFKECGE